MKRKLHTKLIRSLVRKPLKLMNLYDTYPPYDYVQRVSEQNIHSYLGLKEKDILNWVIVGGCLGHEVPRILKQYPNCTVTIFECSNRYIGKLRNRFGRNARVKIVEKAVSDEVGTVDFYETNFKGSGSLLEVGELSKQSYGMEQAEKFSVETITLDQYFPEKSIDVIQIDVQGAELKVLKGASRVLKKSKSVFSEVSVDPDLYQGSVTLDELHALMNEAGYRMALLGTGFNLTGNALFLNKEDP